jgi:hypothetical protein
MTPWPFTKLLAGFASGASAVEQGTVGVALDAADEADAVKRASAVEALVGHPQRRWEALRSKVQDDGVRQFSDVVHEFLDLMWCLDSYRTARVPPVGMGNQRTSSKTRLEGVYRGKGNWFATLLALLLDNRTGEKLRSRGRIAGFSQNHQIDLAWPDREVAPIICAESKVTGAPSYDDTPARGALADWSNRRKELKFGATDLKLHRREQSEDIGHWDVWRRDALPKCFMLWAARLSPGDKIEAMVKEASDVVRTYLDGAGIVAWTENPQGDGYVLVPLPAAHPASESRVFSLDDALWRIESEIKSAVSKGLGRQLPELDARLHLKDLARDLEGDDKDAY